MKQNEKRIIRGSLSIATFFTLFLFFLMSCGSKDSNKDLITNLVIAQILAGSGDPSQGKAEFRLSNTNALLSARSSNVQQFRTLSATSDGFLTDLSGDNPQNYGDGSGDGFTDHFITPIAAALDICQIVAYKSREKGGPEPGKETLENASLILYDAAVIFQDVNEKERRLCDYADRLSLVPEKQASPRVDIKSIPTDQRADYDRIGIIASSLTYAFSPNDVPEDAYRYMSLELNNSYRGDIITDIFYDGCPNSFLNSPGSYFNEGITNDWVEGNTCTVRPGMIDSNSGIFLLNSEEYFTSPNRYKNPPLANSGVADTESRRLKYKKPSSMDALRSSDPYIMVLNLGEGDPSNLLLDVSIDNVLFWDSNAADNQFSPQLDAQDRPNATSGVDNLTNTSRKNMILHLPTILSSKK
ncbi:sigma factor sigX-regulated lipoprotein SrpA [Leptospira alstonii]|uniref:sigma factor sigX-regulated lipoprotein SrpA n=1 Tax=Leptospira alstonii TaxID=28452 RepID=UPI00077486BB|nr:hypothetical protein [Leptospira alstonii]